MVDQIIRPSDLPRRSVPVATEIVPVDNEVSVAGSTLKEISEAGRPTASEAEALAGTEPFKAMTPLTTKQAIDGQVSPKIDAAISALNLGTASQSDVGDFATASQGALADTAVQPSRTITAGTAIIGGGDLSANRTISLDIASQSEAEAGESNVKGMSPLRTRQALGANVILDAVRLGVPADGVTVSSPALQAVADGDVPEIRLGRSYPEGASTGGVVLDQQVHVPWYKPFIGLGRESRIVAKASPTDPSKPFLALNTNGNGSWEPPNRPYPGILSGEVGNFFLLFDAAAAAGNTLTFAEFGGSYHFHDIHAGGVQTIAKQIDAYCDQVSISRILAYNQPSTNGWLFDLGGTGPAQGDGLIVDSLHTVPFAQPSDPSLNRRVRALRARYRHGGSIRGSINGDYLFDSCSALTFENAHIEQGIIEVRDTAMTLSNSLFYMRGEDRGEWSTVPIQFTYGASAPRKPSVGKMENCGFVYSPDLPGRYSTGKANFSIQSGFQGIVKVENCWRQFYSLIGANSGSRFGIKCGNADFDNYSHIASLQSVYVGERWRIKGTLPELVATEGLTTASLLNEDIWSGSSGTRYYRVQILADSLRRLGRTGSAEVSASPINGGSAVSLALASTARYGGIVRLYSGSSTGSYDKYVDIPVLAGAFLTDNGNDVCGFPWTNRTAGAVDTLNAMQILAYELKPGPTESGADAYGNVVVCVKGDAVRPTVGSWRRGDKIDVITGPQNGSEAFAGWTRRSNCTLASSSNDLVNDWAQEWMDMGQASYTSINFTNIASTLNTVNKVRTIERWDSTSGQFLRAQNEMAAGPWLDRDGATVYTPS